MASYVYLEGVYLYNGNWTEWRNWNVEVVFLQLKTESGKQKNSFFYVGSIDRWTCSCSNHVT